MTSSTRETQGLNVLAVGLAPADQIAVAYAMAHGGGHLQTRSEMDALSDLESVNVVVVDADEVAQNPSWVEPLLSWACSRSRLLLTVGPSAELNSRGTVSLPRPLSHVAVTTVLKIYRSEDVWAGLRLTVDAVEGLRQQDRDLSQLLCHDLRSPMTILRSNLGFLEDATDPTDRHDLLGECKESLDRLILMVDNIQLRAHVDACPKPPSVEAVALHPLLRAALAEMSEIFRLRDARAITELTDVHVFVAGDEGLLRSLVRNLLFNAVEFAPPGSDVVVRTRDNPPWVTVEVEDQGAGVEPDSQGVLFDLQRLGGAKSRRLRVGRAYSPYLVSAIVRLHGGDVAVETPAGGGHRMHVRLPASCG